MPVLIYPFSLYPYFSFSLLLCLFREIQFCCHTVFSCDRMWKDCPHFIHIFFRMAQGRTVMRKPHFSYLRLFCQVCLPHKRSYAYILLPLPLFSFSPYIPSQINRSDPFCILPDRIRRSCICTIGKLNSFFEVVHTISGVSILPSSSTVSPFEDVSSIPSEFSVLLPSAHQICRHGRSQSYNRNRSHYVLREMLSDDIHPSQKSVLAL